MSLFSKLYDRVLQWAGHRHAPWALAGLSFAESSFFPIPPDVMLAPMVLARVDRAWRYAAIATIASVFGGILGYFIGVFAFEAIEPWLQQSHYWDAYLLAKQWFDEWGVWAVFLAGFSPIPYKIFTISAGVISMSFIPFVIASLIGRGARFYLVSGVIVLGGERMERFLRQYIDRIGWLLLVLVVVLYLAIR
jgi:membrane protein YqaA with SNARE-associated domain